jgi:hypothetical protein
MANSKRLTLAEIEDAGHLDCIMEAVELKKETRDWITHWENARIELRQMENKRLSLETQVCAVINKATELLLHGKANKNQVVALLGTIKWHAVPNSLQRGIKAVEILEEEE